jgi:aminoglycoside phosphotransferase (APT) family kinase protein
MILATGARIAWTDLPPAVRAGVEELLGDTVVAAASQPGGFSPGSADRLVTASGRRAFVKAVHPSLNVEAPALHRREARITAALPSDVPAPRLIGVYDDGDWVAVALEDVEGRHPELPWKAAELDTVLTTLRAMARTLTPPPLADLPLARVDLAAALRGWERCSADPPADLDPWIKANLEGLAALTEIGVAALDGDTGVHPDLRSDNPLVRPDGGVVVVDWPWLCRGAAWLDSAMLMVNVRMYGGHDTDALLDRIADDFGVDLAAIRGLLAGMTGFFVDAARRPIPGLPTVTAWRQAQGDALVSWIREWLS